jgi:Flp pilus assembly protein TadG
MTCRFTRLVRIGNRGGQILPMSALMMVVLIAFVGLAVDVGRLFIARAELVRAVDAAALAGVLEMPDTSAAYAKAATYMHENEPAAQVQTSADLANRQLKVDGTKPVDVLFMRVFGFDSIDVSASATAGFGIVAVDTVLVMDTTLSMGYDQHGWACSSTPGCPIYEAKKAAKSFVQSLLGETSSGDTLIGLSPYRGCYNPPRSYSQCVVNVPSPNAWVTPLTDSTTTLNSKINSFVAESCSGWFCSGVTGTNICLGLDKAASGSSSVLFQSHHNDNVMRVAVLLSDGQNMYLANEYGQSQPPPECRPSYPQYDDSNVRSDCGSYGQKQKELDTKTITLVNDLKAEGVEIYVVGLGVCGSPSTALCNSSKIGTSCSGSYCDDSLGNRNLLKCIASSSPGTNDHYFETTDPTELSSIFGNIARLIGFRLIK